MSGKMSSIHYDWLQLIEVSGPFLSTTVLNEAFPDGLDGLDKRVKRDLSRFYSEWVDACETKHPQFPELHAAWIQAVLREGLGFLDGDLVVGTGAGWKSNGGDCYEVVGEGGLGKFSPDYALKGMDSKPVLFIKVLPADAKPEGRDVSDEWKDSIVEKMTRLCRAHEVRIGLVTNGEKWVVVNAAPGGTLSGTATWYARLWFQEDTTLRAFLALLGYRRFTGAPKKRLPFLLDESLKHLEEVTDTLGQQVMTAVEVLMEGFDRADLDAGRTLLAGVSPTTLYEAALTVMMRLVFLLCAEERGLMLLGEKKYDDAYAVSTLRKKLEEDSDKFGPQVLERRYDAWARLLGVFRLVYSGINHNDLRFPAMGGSLFDPDKYPFLEGNPPPLPIDNRTVLLILESLQVLKHKNGAIPLSFRSLDVEQIGYIYEGLLEFTGARADETLLGLKGDKTHLNPEIALAELESLALDSEDKLLAYVKEVTGRSALAREYASEPDIMLMPQLVKVCRGDEKLKARILPFLNWMRTSEWGDPVVYHEGSFFVTEGADRRATGTHYTPKALTEMIAKEALEPVVYDGPAKGTPRAEWKLKTPAELLNLKVCDPAMGSGAFLVQACRYLGDRVVEAWAAAEKEGKAIASDGSVTDFPPNDPISAVQEDRLCIARQLVAEKCLYGVDINPLAVELAKLSLWLVTISKNRPFGFLDHNLKSGDSLLGVSDIEQLAQFRMKPDPHFGGNLMTARIRETVAEAAAEREEIRNAHVRDITDVQLQMAHNEKAEQLTEHVRQLADYFIGKVLVLGKPTKKTSAALDNAAMNASILLDPQADSVKATILEKETIANLAYDLPVGQTAARRPFHWAIEFPEVFAQGGFDAICGNPPFMGGKHITGNYGTAYRDHLLFYLADGTRGNADLVAYFYLRAYSLLHFGGDFGLIACNTIAEGDTRQVGLERMVKAGGTIYSAHPNMPWPGTASVVISPVFLMKGVWHGTRHLSGNRAEIISPFLSGQEEWSPKPLVRNKNLSYQGSLVLGKAFVLENGDFLPWMGEARFSNVIQPYLNGDDLNTNIGNVASRRVINFYDWPLRRDSAMTWENLDADQARECYRHGIVPMSYAGPVASDYPEVLRFLEDRIRELSPSMFNDENRPAWWTYWRTRSELYHSIGRGSLFARHPTKINPNDTPLCEKVIVTARVTKYFAPCIVENKGVFHEKLIVFVRASFGHYAFLNSSEIQEWVWSKSSTLGMGLNFSPTDSYETLPLLPDNDPYLDDLGEKLDNLRRVIMFARQIGLTALYNLFHNPTENDAEFEEMRRLQREIDIAVRDSYGWQDIDLEHGFHEVGYLPANDNVRYTISEPARIEILKRLSALNRQRWEEEEAAGLHKKGKK